MAPRSKLNASTAVVPSNDKPAATTNKMALSYVVGPAWAIGEFKANDVLTNERVIDSFIRLHLIARDELNEKKLDGVKRADVIATLLSTDVSDMTPDDACSALVDAVADADYMLHGAEDIPTADAIAAGSNLSYATAFGAKVSEEFEAHWNKAIEGEKDKDAGPIVTMLDLTEMDKRSKGELMDNVPIIGTRFRNLKSDRAPYGFRLPSDTSPQNASLPVFNGPFDYSKTYNTTLAKDVNVHWVASFVRATPSGGHFADMVDQCKAILSNGPKQDCPKELWAYADKDKNFDQTKIKALLDEYAFQFNKRVRITSRAFQLIQKIRAAETRFKFSVELVGVRDFDETPEQAARRRKPFAITWLEKNEKTGRDIERTFPQLQTMGRIANLEPRKHPANATPAAVFKVNRGTKGGAEANKQQSAALVPEIKTTDKLEEYLSAVSNALDKADFADAVAKKTTSGENEGKLASDIVGTAGLLNTLITDEMRELARQHDLRESKVVAAKMKGKREQAAQQQQN